MTRDEKIEALARDMYDAGWLAGATLAQDRIDAAGTNWTRVEDGLPEPDRIVQLTVLCEDGEREIRHTRYRGRDDGWRDVGTYVRPLAWAPLPEPWRG